MSRGAPEGNAPTHTPAAVRHERVREVHKSAWLKWLHTSYDKKGIPFVKRAEKWWVVFCIHDDVDAFLEFYTEPKMAQIHKPSTRVNLVQLLHISPSIVGQDNEFQFAVTLSSQVICLAATDWDQMLEWVESMQGKLREMNILSPRDNLYSKLPETRNYPVNTAAVSTRDPNSPLPPTPNGYMSTEFMPVRSAQPSSSDTDNSPRSQLRIALHAESIFTPDSRPLELVSTSTSTSVYVQSGRNGTQLHRSNSDTGNATVGSNTPESTGFLDLTRNNNAAFTRPEYNPTTNVGTHTSINSTLVQIEFANPVVDSPSSLSALNQTVSATGEYPANPIPQVTHKCSSQIKSWPNSRKHNTDPGVNLGGLLLSVPANESTSAEFRRQISAQVDQNAAPSANQLPAARASSGMVYEHIVGAGASASAVSTNNIVPSVSEANFPPVVPRRHPNGKRTPRRHAEPAAEPHHALASTPQNLENGVNVTSQICRNSHNGANPQPQAHATAYQSSNPAETEESPLEGMIGLRRGEYRVAPARRPNGVEHSTSTFEASSVNGGSSICAKDSGSSHVPLKESQVMRLNLEINHIPGVRIILRRRDCHGTIAFVDYLGSAWIAGWKQQEHPVLYYAFHIGDQILKIGGTKVHSSEEIRRAIKMTTSHQVEFIIRRLPYGKVFVLKRRIEGEPLGLIAVGNCSEISEVVPNSLAAAAGLTPQATSVDGQLACSWFLTEINNRPLSLFARENEVRDRLNAVGKEISILVQPSDLVKHLKKHLKTIKGFKDYLVV